MHICICLISQAIVVACFCTFYHFISDISSIFDKGMLHFAKTNICNKLTKRYTRWARSLFVNNLNHTDYMGYAMLLNQFISAYSLYFIIFYLTIAYIYFTSKNENILQMSILLTSFIISGFHFFWTLLFYFVDY